MLGAVPFDDARKTLEAGGRRYAYYSLAEAGRRGLRDAGRLPASLRILLENVLRSYPDGDEAWEDAKALDEWARTGSSDREVSFSPARVVLQDFTGVPALVDLAAMRDAVAARGGDPGAVNPRVPTKHRAAAEAAPSLTRSFRRRGKSLKQPT